MQNEIKSYLNGLLTEIEIQNDSINNLNINVNFADKAKITAVTHDRVYTSTNLKDEQGDYIWASLTHHQFKDSILNSEIIQQQEN